MELAYWESEKFYYFDNGYNLRLMVRDFEVINDANKDNHFATFSLIKKFNDFKYIALKEMHGKRDSDIKEMYKRLLNESQDLIEFYKDIDTRAKYNEMTDKGEAYDYFKDVFEGDMFVEHFKKRIKEKNIKNF